jgi:multidrug resistance efflux pump
VAIVYLNPFDEQLANAKRQLDALQMQEQLLTQNLHNTRQQIQQVQVAIKAYEALVAQQQITQVQTTSLADLCRTALDAYQGEFITAQEVRSYIEQLGFSLEYNNIMAVLHNTLARVGRKGRNAFGTVYARK